MTELRCEAMQNENDCGHLLDTELLRIVHDPSHISILQADGVVQNRVKERKLSRI